MVGNAYFYLLHTLVVVYHFTLRVITRTRKVFLVFLEQSILVQATIKFKVVYDQMYLIRLGNGYCAKPTL